MLILSVLIVVYNYFHIAIGFQLCYIIVVHNTCFLKTTISRIDKLYMRIPLERNSQSALAVRLSAPNGKFIS